MKNTGKAWLESRDEDSLWRLFDTFANRAMSAGGDDVMAENLTRIADMEGCCAVSASTWQRYRLSREDPKWKAFVSKRNFKEIGTVPNKRRRKEMNETGCVKEPKKELFSYEVRQTSSDLVQSAISLRSKADDIVGKLMGQLPPEVVPATDKAVGDAGDLATISSNLNSVRDYIQKTNKALDRL